MANTLGAYNPIFYANEALELLEKALGMSGTIHREFEQERRQFGRGDTVKIKKPSTFTAQNAPSTAQDVATKEVELSITNWKEVKFEVRDDELTYTGEQLIAQHLRPAAYAIADQIDRDLCLLAKDVPWVYDLNATPGSVVNDVTGPHRVLFDNEVPMGDPGAMYYMVNGALQEGLLSNSSFAQWQGAGPTGEQTQIRGALGERYGLNFFANQNVQAHTAGALSTTSVLLNGAHAKGATTLVLDAGTLTGDVKKGDTLVIAGNAQRYAIAADATAAGNAITVTIKEGLAQAYSDNTAVTVDQTSTDAENLAYHRNAFGLVMADLPMTLPERGGADVFTATSPDGTISIRATMAYDIDTRMNIVALDVIYALGLLDGDMAVRCRDAA